jgi:hypothetical protein
MAIAYDSTASGNSVTPGSGSISWNHTCGGSNRLLLVGIDISSNSSISGVTYNSVSMTQLYTQQYSSTEVVYIYGLLAPDTGTNSVVVSWSGSQYVRANSVSYKGVKQSSLPDASNGINGSVSSTGLSQGVTTIANNCWVFATLFKNNNDSVTPAAGTTVRSSDFSNTLVLVDTNGPKTPAGLVSIGLNWTNGTYCYMALVSFAPSGTDYTIVSDYGSFVLSGISSIFGWGRKLVASVGSIVLTGISITFKMGHGIVASVGSFILSGINATLRRSGWNAQDKSSSTWSSQTKNSSTWNSQNK